MAERRFIGRMSEIILDKIYDVLVKMDKRLKSIEDSLKKEKKDYKKKQAAAKSAWSFESPCP